MRTGTLAVGCAGLLALTACGGSSSDPGATQATADRTSIATYQDLTTQVQSAALSYGAAFPGEATAPGQLLAADLLDVYAVGRPRRVFPCQGIRFSRLESSPSSSVVRNAFISITPLLYFSKK